MPAAIALPGLVGQHASRTQNGCRVEHVQAARSTRNSQNRLEQGKHEERQCPPPPAVTGQEGDSQYQQCEQHDSHAIDPVRVKRARLTSRSPSACTEYTRPSQEQLHQDVNDEDCGQVSVGNSRCIHNAEASRGGGFATGQWHPRTGVPIPTERRGDTMPGAAALSLPGGRKHSGL